MQTNNNSKVARLLQCITTEHEAAQRGIQGLAEGTAKHKFIEAHMQRVWSLKDELSREVGNEGEAMKMACRLILDESASEVCR